MLPSSTLTRPQFQEACKAFLHKYNSHGPSLVHACCRGWEWSEHARVNGFGFLSRSVIFSMREQHLDHSLDEELIDDASMASNDDEATSSFSATEAVISTQSVVFSPTFQVPVFYFTAHDSKGSPFELAQIMKTALFRRHAFAETEVTAFALSSSSSPFPLLSQGDHPTLGTPSWYIHPCETPAALAELTSEVMAEVMPEEGPTRWAGDAGLIRYMEIWFMLLGNVVDLNP